MPRFCNWNTDLNSVWLGPNCWYRHTQVIRIILYPPNWCATSCSISLTHKVVCIYTTLKSKITGNSTEKLRPCELRQGLMLYQLVHLSTKWTLERCMQSSPPSLYKPLSSLTTSRPIVGFLLLWMSTCRHADMYIYVHIHNPSLEILEALPCILRRHHNCWKKTFKCSFTTVADAQNIF